MPYRVIIQTPVGVLLPERLSASSWFSFRTEIQIGSTTHLTSQSTPKWLRFILFPCYLNKLTLHDRWSWAFKIIYRSLREVSFYVSPDSLTFPSRVHTHAISPSHEPFRCHQRTSVQIPPRGSQNGSPRPGRLGDLRDWRLLSYSYNAEDRERFKAGGIKS